MAVAHVRFLCSGVENMPSDSTNKWDGQIGSESKNYKNFENKYINYDLKLSIFRYTIKFRACDFRKINF